MSIFFAAITLVVLLTLLWVVKQLGQISGNISNLNHKFDNLISVLEKIELNTENASKFLGEESQAYQEWKHELEASEDR